MMRFFCDIPDNCKPPIAPLDLKINPDLREYLLRRCVSNKKGKCALPSEMQCNNGKCSGMGKCRYHLLLDPWMHVASCYSTFSLCDSPMNSDETALCNIMINCNAFSNREREVTKNILDCIRNPSSHFKLHMHFNEAYVKMKKIAVTLCRSDEERDRIISRIDENHSRCLRFIPAKNGLEQISQNRQYMKLLTQEQCEKCKFIMHCRKIGQHLLLEAVAGSGKTMLIAYLTAQYVNEGLRDNILVVTHGKFAFRYALMKELNEQLDLVHRGPCLFGCAEKVVETEEHIVYSVSDGNGKLHYIVCCTIDHLIMSRLRQVDLTESLSDAETVIFPRLNRADGRAAVDDAKRAMLSLDQRRFCHIFVDEGHHVFNFEKELHLQGQHILEDNSQVRELVEDLLAESVLSTSLSSSSMFSSPTSSFSTLELLSSSRSISSSSSASGQYHPMVTVFHDHSCQSNTSVLPYPFEGNITRVRAMESSIRMPKSVTDQCIPFARSLSESRLGFTEFFPLNEHAVAGVPVSYEDVRYDRATNEFYYGTHIGRVLEKLKEDGLLNDCSQVTENNNLRLAVIFPRETDEDGGNGQSTRVWSASKIEETARDAVNFSRFCPAEDIFPGVDVRSGNVVWTWAANMAGLEADIVIIVGNIAERFSSVSIDNVSAEMFVAASRCMHKLIIVAPNAATIGGHYKIGMTKEGVVEYSLPFSRPPTMVTDRGSKIFLQLVVDKDFRNEDSHLLVNAYRMTLRHYVNSVESPFQWQLCKKKKFDPRDEHF